MLFGDLTKLQQNILFYKYNLMEIELLRYLYLIWKIAILKCLDNPNYIYSKGSFGYLKNSSKASLTIVMNRKTLIVRYHRPISL